MKKSLSYRGASTRNSLPSEVVKNYANLFTTIISTIERVAADNMKRWYSKPYLTNVYRDVSSVVVAKNALEILVNFETLPSVLII